MTEPMLLAELLACTAQRQPGAVALTSDKHAVSYAELDALVRRFAGGLCALGVQRGMRVAVYLEKRVEAVVASFGTAAAGAAFVPVNPLLKPAQVAYILRDCQVCALVTSPERLAGLADVLAQCPDLRHVVLTAPSGAQAPAFPGPGAFAGSSVAWDDLLAAAPRAGHRVTDADLAAIFYTSGSTGGPKGVMLSHRNLVSGAKSVVSYLGNGPHDSLLAVLPLSFDAGFSQLTTAFLSGARAVLLNYLLPRDVLQALAAQRITGLTAVPPLFIQLARLEWPAAVQQHLRYFANTGGHMPGETLTLLRQRVPAAKPFLMYGLTEAFRSTYLPPEEVDRRPDSIGKAIPNAEILVLRADGSPCGPDEPGELVHRGALVALGYWNDAPKTAERFKPLPAAALGPAAQQSGQPLPEFAVFSGDVVRQDADGFLYFIGRNDEMLKTSGYRISPTEVEEALYATGLVGECAVFGAPHAELGQVVCAVVTPAASSAAGSFDSAALLARCRERMPAYMVPAVVHVAGQALPRNPNGKIDRKALALHYAGAAA